MRSLRTITLDLDSMRQLPLVSASDRRSTRRRGKGKGKDKRRRSGFILRESVFEFDGKSGRAWERKTLNSENRGHVILPCYDCVGLRGLNGLLINPICQSAT